MVRCMVPGKFIVNSANFVAMSPKTNKFFFSFYFDFNVFWHGI